MISLRSFSQWIKRIGLMQKIHETSSLATLPAGKISPAPSAHQAHPGDLAPPHKAFIFIRHKQDGALRKQKELDKTDSDDSVVVG